MAYELCKTSDAHEFLGLQLGDRFALFYTLHTCECGSPIMTGYLTFRDEVEVLGSAGELLEVRIPLCANRKGTFKPRPDMSEFSDEHIVEVATEMHEAYPESDIVCHWFAGIERRIRTRTAFRKFYFRCFRRAFAPGRKQARKSVEEWGRL